MARFSCIAIGNIDMDELPGEPRVALKSPGALNDETGSWEQF